MSGFESCTTVSPMPGGVVTGEFIATVREMQELGWTIVGFEDMKLPCGMPAIALEWLRPVDHQKKSARQRC